jgi:hypothetical protein
MILRVKQPCHYSERNQSKDAPCENPNPQERLVRRIAKVGIPDLLEFRTKLSQFRWLGTPFDARVDTADAMVNKSKTAKKE